VGNSAPSWLAKTVSIGMSVRLSAKRAGCLKKIGALANPGRIIGEYYGMVFCILDGGGGQFLPDVKASSATLRQKGLGGFFLLHTNRHLRFWYGHFKN
jgi:hypothetical protein